MDLNHGRLFRLLKLVQRNPGLTPPKEVFNRWNAFCDSFAPHDGGRPTRDPKRLDRELILRFLTQELPRYFWISMVKKIQKSGVTESHTRWDDFCDQHAPSMGSSQRAIHDPQKLPTELLLAFIACALERDDRTGTKELAAVIDSFQFNFSAGDAPGSTAAGTPRTDSLAGGARRPTVVEPRLPRAGGGGPPAAPVVVGRRMRSRSPPHQGRGGREEGHHRPRVAYRRLLKLVQRLEGLNPPKAVFLRWNEFCDEFAPKTREGGQGTRDPSRLSDDLIRRFLVNLPPGFWVNLVKKVQKEGKEDGLSQAWEEYCDRNAPTRPGGAGPTRDPRMVPPEFLVDFLGHLLEVRRHEGDKVAGIIDAYNYDFEIGGHLRTERQAPAVGAAEGKGAPRKGGGKGDGRHARSAPRGGGKDRDDRGGDRPHGDGDDPAVQTLSRLVRLLQRGSNPAKRCWDTYCDEKAPRPRGGAAVRDPRRLPSDFLQEFLAFEVPVHASNLWSRAVEEAAGQDAEVKQLWEDFAEKAIQDNMDPWSMPPLLVDFLVDCVSSGRESAALAVEVAAAECFDAAGSPGGGAAPAAPASDDALGDRQGEAEGGDAPESDGGDAQ